MELRERHRAMFVGFCSAFYFEDDEHFKNYKLKEKHSLRVCDNSDEILGDAVHPELRDITWISSLYHDLGRFPQYMQYRTFKDSESVNHGLLSSLVLQRGNLLDEFNERQKGIIINAVKFHNAYHIPPDITDEDTITALKVVRDADKLDIWKVFIDFYNEDDSTRPSAVGLGFPDTPTYSPSFVEGIYNNTMLRLSDVKCLNDFKLLQLSWVFDLNLNESLRILQKRQYIDLIANTLPDTHEIRGVMTHLKDYI
ncbi:MAG: HD domain-containing protein, partial [Thermodesulfovibrionales bacterium]